MKYADGNKAIINHNPKRGDNIIIKKINENDNFCYYDETFKQVSEEIKIRNANTREVLILSKDLNLAEIKELSLLINGFAFVNLFGGANGYNLANIDNFIKSTNKEKAKPLGEILDFQLECLSYQM